MVASKNFKSDGYWFESSRGSKKAQVRAVKSTARRVTESDLLEQAAQIVGALLEFILSVAHCDRAATLCTIT